MPATVLEDPLGLSCVFSDGRRGEFLLGDVANPQLARDLLVGLAELVHPHGSVDAAGSVRHYVRAVRGMVATLAGHGFIAGAAGLRRGQLAEYWMGAGAAREACTRRMLLGFAAAGGRLDAGVRELAEGRAYNLQPYRRPLPPYPEAAWGRLTQAAERAVDTAYRAHRDALAGAGRGQDPATGGCELDNLRWLLARTGPMTVFDLAARLEISVETARRRTGLREVAGELFPHLDVTVAYVLLFSVYSGIVPDGIDDLTTGDIDWAGDATILLSYVKGRTSAESLTLPRRAVRLLEQWLEHSSLLRGFVPAPERDQLWLGVRQRGHSSVIAGPVHRNVTHRWLARHGVVDDTGPTWRHGHEHRGRPARPDPAGPAPDRARRRADRRPGAGLSRTGRLAPARCGGAQRAGRRPTGRVHRGLRRSTVRTARPQGQTVPGPALGVSAVSPRRVRAAARTEPAAAEELLLPPMAAAAERPVHGRVRALLPAGRAGPGPLRPRRAGRGHPADRRPRRRATPAP